ncbi:hypothetical protein [Candidatus Spongiihabitans sp.]|uniref:hypothetical protein n=1 Tax=Candidatus Spongiihabitans sp. TaxID=3101308 RepID=UPI003C703599
MKNVFLLSLLFVFFVPVQVFSYTDKEWCDSLPPYYYGNSYYDADKDKPYCLLVCGASFKMLGGL